MQLKAGTIFLLIIGFVLLFHIPLWLMIDIQSDDPYAQKSMSSSSSQKSAKPNSQDKQKQQPQQQTLNDDDSSSVKLNKIDPHLWTSRITSDSDNHQQNFFTSSFAEPIAASKEMEVLDYQDEKQEEEEEADYYSSRRGSRGEHQQQQQKQKQQQQEDQSRKLEAMKRIEIETEIEMSQFFQAPLPSQLPEAEYRIYQLHADAAQRKMRSFEKVIILCVSGKKSLDVAKSILLSLQNDGDRRKKKQRDEEEQQEQEEAFVILVAPVFSPSSFQHHDENIQQGKKNHHSADSTDSSSRRYITTESDLHRAVTELSSNFPDTSHAMFVAPSALPLPSSPKLGINVWSLLPAISTSLLPSSKNDMKMKSSSPNCLIFFGPSLTSLQKGTLRSLMNSAVCQQNSDDEQFPLRSRRLVGCSPVSASTIESLLPNRHGVTSSFHLGQGLEVQQGKLASVVIDERFAGFSSKDRRTRYSSSSTNEKDNDDDEEEGFVTDVHHGVPLATPSPFCFAASPRVIFENWPGIKSNNNNQVSSSSSSQTSEDILRRMNEKHRIAVSYSPVPLFILDMENDDDDSFVRIDTHLDVLSMLLNAAGDLYWKASSSVSSSVEVLFHQATFFGHPSWNPLGSDNGDNNGNNKMITKTGLFELTTSEGKLADIFSGRVSVAGLARVLSLSQLPIAWWPESVRNFASSTLMMKRSSILDKDSQKTKNKNSLEKNKKKKNDKKEQEEDDDDDDDDLQPALIWESFCIACFGFTNEVMHFAWPLEGRMPIRLRNDPSCFCSGTPRSMRRSLVRLSLQKVFEVAPPASSSSSQGDDDQEQEQQEGDDDNEHEENEDEEKAELKEEENDHHEDNSFEDSVLSQFHHNNDNNNKKKKEQNPTRRAFDKSLKSLQQQARSRRFGQALSSGSSSSSSSSALFSSVQENSNQRKPRNKNNEEKSKKQKNKKKKKKKNKKKYHRHGKDDYFIILVIHKDPGSLPMYRPGAGEQGLYRKPDAVVARAMYEFTEVPENWRERDKVADEVWVPSRFVRWVFKTSKNGNFDASKLVVMPEPIDAYYWSPEVVEPLSLPSSLDILRWKHDSTRSQHHEADLIRRLAEKQDDGKGKEQEQEEETQQQLSKHFKFFSAFKMEDRKGWEILLGAFLEEFQPHEQVSLYLSSYIYGDDSRDPKKIMNQFVKKVARNVLSSSSSASSASFSSSEWKSRVPHIEIISERLPEHSLVELYRSVDAFVLPTRGEGWGLPTIQAMSMGLPVISTNFSGSVDFTTSDTCYLIPIEGLEALPEENAYSSSAQGKDWAVPSKKELRKLMRQVFSNPKEAKEKGARARDFIVSQFSDEAIAEIVARRSEHLKNTMVFEQEENDEDDVQVKGDDINYRSWYSSSRYSWNRRGVPNKGINNNKKKKKKEEERDNEEEEDRLGHLIG